MIRRGAGAAAAARTESSSDTPTVAAVTMTRDEGQMLKRWVKYYSDALGPTNLIIFDDNSVDGSTDNLDCTVYRLPTFPGGERFIPSRMKLANGIAAGLLACYDFVIFADVDEFFIPDPNQFDGLLDFLKARRRSDVIAGMALNVVHHPGVEAGEIDPDRPILDQRSFAKFMPRMCKPAIKRIPAQWRRSTHAITAPYGVDPGLFMMHMKFHDQESLQALGDRRRAVFEADSRGFRSSWRLTGEEITREIAEAVTGQQRPEDVPEFVPDPALLETVVVKVQESYESGPGSSQMKAMRERPLVRIPERLRGIV
jgi:Glycosyl transferase family 2